MSRSQISDLAGRFAVPVRSGQVARVATQGGSHLLAPRRGRVGAEHGREEAAGLLEAGPDDTIWVTIQDIIDRANDTKAAEVTVDWPAGQDYPNSVYIDQNKKIADEEQRRAAENAVEDFVISLGIFTVEEGRRTE